MYSNSIKTHKVNDIKSLQNDQETSDYKQFRILASLTK